MNINKLLQTIVAIDDAAVEVVHIRGGVAAALKRNHRAKRRRNDGNAREEEPLGAHARSDESGDK